MAALFIVQIPWTLYNTFMANTKDYKAIYFNVARLISSNVYITLGIKDHPDLTF